MRINSITSNTQCSFGSFNVTPYGAQVLAEKFVEDPTLEAEFMLNIAKPLDNIDGDVVFDGFKTTFKYPTEGKPSIVHSLDASCGNILAIVSSNYSRQAYRKTTDTVTTNIFNGCYPLNEIEAAKNIMLDKEAFYDKIAADKYSETHKNETVELKAKRLLQKFCINA